MQAEVRPLPTAKAKREKFSSRDLTYQLIVPEADMWSLLEALEESLRHEQPRSGWRTLRGLEEELRLYERLHRLACGSAPQARFCDELKRQYGGGEFQRVIEEARQRWTV